MDEEIPDPHWMEAPDGWTYYDEMTGLALPGMLVRAARREEMQYMLKMGVFREATEEERLRLWPLPSRWVDIDKGDPKTPNVRCRLAACETRSLSWNLGVAETYSATPPYAALRMILAITCVVSDTGYLFDVPVHRASGYQSRCVGETRHC